MAETIGPILGSGPGGSSGGTISDITSTDGSVKITDPTGPTTDLSVPVSSPSKVTAQSSNYTAKPGDIVLATGGSGGINILTPSSTANGQFAVKKVDPGVGAITITAASGTIDGAATQVILIQYQSLTLVADGTNWNLI